MQSVTAAGGAGGAGFGATAEVCAAAVGEALRTVRERVRAAALRRGNDSHGGSSSSTSTGDSSSGSEGSCSSASTRCEISSKSMVRATAARAGVPVRLVAVSKRQDAAAVAAAAAAGQTHFAENYVQELISKSKELKHLNLSWHMIGHLQSNKAKQLLAACPDLYMVETVDSIRLAHILDAAVAAVMPQRSYKPLRVLVQVNTSGEDSKSGLRLSPKETAAGAERDSASPSRWQQDHEERQRQEEQQQSHRAQREEQHTGELQALVQCIVKECSHLRFAGLMTIGPSDAAGARQAFATLAAIKRDLLDSLPAVQKPFEIPLGPSGRSLPPLRDEELRDPRARSPLDDYSVDEKERIFELSMGMSSDFDEAIEAGSTEVRVGTAIFGQRC